MQRDKRRNRETRAEREKEERGDQAGRRRERTGVGKEGPARRSVEHLANSRKPSGHPLLINRPGCSEVSMLCCSTPTCRKRLQSGLQASPNPERLPRVYKWGAPAGDGGKRGAPAKAADHGEAGSRGHADLGPRPPLRGRQGDRRPVGLGRWHWLQRPLGEGQAGQNAAQHGV